MSKGVAALVIVVVSFAVALVSRPRKVIAFTPGESAVVVTGCSSGLGLALALDLAERGYLVFAGVRRFPSKELEAKRQALGDAHARDLIVQVQLDVSNRPAIEAAVEQVNASLRKIGSQRTLVGIVNNAGISASWHILNVKPTDLEDAFKTNVFSIVHMVQLFSPLLARPGGRIVNVGSLMGLFALPKTTPYSATKWALEGLSDAIRYDLQDLGFSVSLIEPGFFTSGQCKHDLCKVSPADTVEAIVDALQSERPQARYATASVMVLPGWLVAYARVLPQWLHQAILSNVA